jgi:predicted metal-dependent HD superfamily phosphohydrolase
MNYEIELKKIEDYVIQYLNEHGNANFYYHNLTHTTDVVEATKEIANYYKLDEHACFLLTAAAWFHDIGYPVDMANHETVSADTAAMYLKNSLLKDEEIEIIKKCILATKVPQQPHSLFEEIICDADLYYLGTDRYKQTSALLKKEMQSLNNNTPVDGFEWRSEKIRFFESHHYHTDYCRLKLDQKKQENLLKLKNKQMATVAGQMNPIDQEQVDTEKKKKKKNDKIDNKPTRGIETMFRISAANSVRVSVMADNKAHIMISVNSIVISVVLAFLIRNIDEYMHLLIPTIMLVAVNIITITFAVLATRPKISKGVFTQKQVEDKSVNLLYFGSFYKMNYPEYQEAVNKMMNDSEFLYGSLTKDIFWQGKVLGRKYRLLRISYNVFMYGMIASVMAFIITSVLK